MPITTSVPSSPGYGVPFSRAATLRDVGSHWISGTEL